MGSKSDQAQGLANQAAGKLKPGSGKVTGSKETQAKGVAQEVKGKAQQAMGKAKSVVKDTASKVADRANKKMVLDLAKVSHLNSIAIGLLVGTYTNYQKRGGRILLANVDKRIQNVFVVTKLSLVFELAESRQKAIEALGA